MANVVPSFAAFEGSEVEAKEYAMKDAMRRHLTPSQRAIMIVELSHPASLQDATPSQAEMAKKGKVSERLIADAVKVDKEGTEKLKEAVKENLISVPDAAKVADLPAKVQDAAVKEVKSGKSKTVRKSKAATEREPGDDTEANAATRKRHQQNGKVLFDWKIYNAVWDKLYLKPDEMRKAFKQPESPQFQALLRLLMEFDKGVREYFKVASGSAAPKRSAKK